MNIVDQVKVLQAKFFEDAQISPKNFFNQYKNNILIELYTHSKFKNITPQEAESRGIVFQNITSQALRTAIRKTNIDEKSVTLEVKDKFTNYLGQVANTEFLDDEEMGKYSNKVAEQYYKFGTVITVTDPSKPKGERVQLVNFNKVIWDVNDYKNKPIMFTDSVDVHTLLNDDTFKTDALYADIKDDINEIGSLNILNVFYKKDGVKRYAVIAFHEDKEYKVYDERTSVVISVLRRNPVFNRSAGQSLVEELFEAQKNVNEGANLLIEDLRASAKNIFITDDEELDGLDLSEFTNLTVLKTERNTKLEQLYKTTSSFGALSSYVAQQTGASKELSNATNAALGASEGSREAVGLRGFKLQEIEGNFAYEKEQIALYLRKMYKEVWLGIVYGYFGNIDKLEKLLTKDQKHSFYIYVAESLSHDYTALLFLEDFSSVNSKDVAQSIYKLLQEGNIEKFVDFSDIVMTKSQFVDKVRVDIVGEQSDKSQELQTLQLLAQNMAQNPQAYLNANFTLEDITAKIANISGSDTYIELFSSLSKHDPINNQEQITQ